MNPEEHYRRAEELLAEAEADVARSIVRSDTLARLAGVHAQLAAIGSPLAWQRPRTGERS